MISTIGHLNTFIALGIVGIVEEIWYGVWEYEQSIII
jgi:hypothetical protein